MQQDSHTTKPLLMGLPTTCVTRHPPVFVLGLFFSWLPQIDSELFYHPYLISPAMMGQSTIACIS